MAEDILFTDLDSIRIAKPCRAVWKDMQQVDGNRVRHCRERQQARRKKSENGLRC